MTGTIALQGGAPFQHDELDRRLLEGVDRVVVLPTADAFETPDALLDDAAAWADRLGVTCVPARVLTRRDAADLVHAAAVEGAGAVWLVGDSPLHLRSALKDTPVWAAIVALWQRGGVIGACGGSAAALCNPMLDPRGGAFTLGLGLVDGVAFVPEAEAMSEERLARTLKIADVPVLAVVSTAAALRTASGWEFVGDVAVHGEV